MNIVLAVPYGMERSGLIIIATRLEHAFSEARVKAMTIAKTYGTSFRGRPIKSFATAEELNHWLLHQSNGYSVLLWVGFYQHLGEIETQIRDAQYLREKRGKRVFFMWERTGSKDVIPNEALFHQLIEKATDGIIALNKDHVDDLKGKLVPTFLVHLLPPGVDTSSQFVPPTSVAERQRLRQELGWDNQTFVALCVGRFETRKRPHTLINLWLDDDRLRATARLVLIGSGFGSPLSIELYIRQLATRSNSISIVTHRDDLDFASYYRAADAFVLPSVLEGEPSVLSEAMACGLPAIVSNIAGHRGLVWHEKTGLVFEPDNLRQLRSALYRLMGDAAYRHLLGQAARDLVARERDISLVVQRLLVLFSQGSGGQPQADGS